MIGRVRGNTQRQRDFLISFGAGLRQETRALAQEQAGASAALAAKARARLQAGPEEPSLHSLTSRVSALASEAAALAGASAHAGREQNPGADPDANPGADPGAKYGAQLFGAPRAAPAGLADPAVNPVPERRRSGLLPDDPVVPTPVTGGAGLVTPVGPPSTAAQRFDALRAGGGGAFGGLIASPVAANGVRLENGGEAHGAHAPANGDITGYGAAPGDQQARGGGDAEGASGHKPATNPSPDDPDQLGFAEARGGRRRRPRQKRSGSGAAAGAEGGAPA